MFTPSNGAVVALVAFSVACTSAASNPNQQPGAGAEIRDVAGRPAGDLVATAAPSGGVSLNIRVTGLPAGTHGVHVHMVGVCDPAGPTAFASAGGHLNPGARQHGRLNPNGPHAGDLPNIVVDAAGQGSLVVVADSLTVDTGASALLDADGSAIVVHANPDDERTDTGPSGPGNSGARIACGVIRRR